MTTYSKEHEALVQYPAAQLDCGPWWGSIGSLAAKCTEAKQSKQGAGVGGYGKGVETHVTVSWDGQKTQPHPALPDYHTWLEIGYSPSMICAKYPYADHSYSLLPTYGPQIGGRIMLPLSLTTDEGPIFVNAKQYHGIIRRRQSRAKAELLNKPLRVRKQYLHESRHLHAKRRARGAGGRFLNTTKALNDSKKGKGKVHHHVAQPTGSQNSEVLQTDINGNLNSYPAASASEVASSDYNFHGDLGLLFNIGIPQPSPRSLPNPVGIGQYNMDTMPAVKWALLQPQDLIMGNPSI